MLPRTQRQKEILDYITRFLERHGYVPSYTQIARQFGVKSRATIAKHIAALERRGLLTREHAAIRFFRKVMRASDEAAVFSIETESYLAQPLTKDVTKLEQTIAGFGKPEGGTSLFDAIVLAGGYLRPYSGRKVIVIVSDGIETTSRISEFEAVIQHVLADDAQVYVVQTGLYEGANLRALAAERRMEQLTEQTGGAVYLPKTVSELDVAFDQIAADLSQQYVLSYYPLPEHRDGRLHVIDLKIKTRNDVRLRSRKGYYAPKAASDADW